MLGFGVFGCHSVLHTDLIMVWKESCGENERWHGDMRIHVKCSGGYKILKKEGVY